jgi:hypothetical protein
MIPGQILLPIAHRFPHSRLARKCNNRVQMVGHQQHQPTVPKQPFVVINCRPENNIADAYPAEMIVMLSLAMNRDEKETAFCDPLRNFVRQPFALRAVHATNMAKWPC